MIFLPLLLGVFVASALGTGLLRQYALARNVLDVPNARSSHTVPIPRGGGLSIVSSFVAGTLLLAVSDVIPNRTAIALIGAGTAVAIIGYLDDHKSVQVRWRLLTHFTAALWGLCWLGGLPPVQFFGNITNLGLAGNALALIGLVWLLNLYNFMDGIDGLAGIEVVTVCFGALLLYVLEPGTEVGWILPCILGMSALGFLLWNFPPAKIFMGDSGSGSLGLILGLLAITAARHSPQWLWSWIILLGVFVVDATVTLLRRHQRAQKLYIPHRSHAYQHAAIRFGSHRVVAVGVAFVNLLWLLPIALLVGVRQLDGPLGVIIAYLPLTWVALKLGAGVDDTPPRSS